MKKILIIDDSDLFREFLGQKLGGFGFEVFQASNGFDGMMKLRQQDYDLIIMDYYLSRNSSLEVLEKKNSDPNTKLVPVIMASAKIDRDNLLLLSKQGIRKFFTKPIKIDALLAAIAEILKIKLDVDMTPCSIEANCNDGITFIELSRGLNRDKIELLRYRLSELSRLYHLEHAKALVIMGGLEVGPNDGFQLASFFDIVLNHAAGRVRNIKLLTNAEFIQNYVRSRPNLQGIEICSNLESAMDALINKNLAEGELVEQLGERVAKPGQPGPESGFDLHFEQEIKETTSAFNLQQLAGSVSIAIVDDDFVLREIMKKAFAETGIKVETFSDGVDFVQCGRTAEFDLVFLDLMMPRMDGFQVLGSLNAQAEHPPVIVLSALDKRETVLKAMGQGVKSYLVKPIKPESLRQKAIDMLKVNF